MNLLLVQGTFSLHNYLKSHSVFHVLSSITKTIQFDFKFRKILQVQINTGLLDIYVTSIAQMKAIEYYLHQVLDYADTLVNFNKISTLGSAVDINISTSPQ